MDKLSVIIITRNEESNIRDCLGSVKWAGEIVLVDQSSADKTVEIAKEFTDKIYITENKDFCEPDRMFAISKASNEWILALDADERVSDELKQEIVSLLEQKDKLDAYYIRRRTYFLGKWIKGCGWYANVLRLFKKGKVSFSGRIHEPGCPLGSVGYLRGHIMHYSYGSLNEYFEKFNRYTSVVAKEEYEKGIRINRGNFLLLFFIKPMYFFVRKYFLQRGFMEGWRGFFISFSASLGLFMTYAKLWEKQNYSKK
ncbi:MAG: glycosyltransferase family 2 protein [Candidatus Omnitrophota bacterium]|nr:glycosyltransferase family 2 protein [Candidatus Omnitrophota bacterium]